MNGRFGELSYGHDPVKLTKDWLTMSNDCFFVKYGFSWVPPMYLQNKIQKAMPSRFTIMDLADELGRLLK